MVLAPILAMNGRELAASAANSPIAWMSCHFSPCSKGLSNLPLWLPEGSVLIVDDQFPCQGHSADLVAEQLLDVAGRLSCESVLLDFQRPENPEIPKLITRLLEVLSCPVAVSELYAAPFRCPVFLGPGSLPEPLESHLDPWRDREIWLEAALCRQTVTVTRNGADLSDLLPWEGPEEGFFDEVLCCHYHTKVSENSVEFTLFDTPESLRKKLELAHSLGVTRAIGLFQQLHKLS